MRMVVLQASEFGASWQWIATGFVVGGAVVYLIWKLGFASRRRTKSKGQGPDVPLDRLVKKRTL